VDASEILLTFAEVSVALAGFIGITAAFRQRSTSWSADDLRVPFRGTMIGCYFAVTAAVALAGVFGIVVQGAYVLGVAMLLLAAVIEFLVFVAALQD